MENGRRIPPGTQRADGLHREPTLQDRTRSIVHSHPAWQDVSARRQTVPYSATCRTLLETDRSIVRGSGWFLTPQLVVTAGHSAVGKLYTDREFRLWIIPSATGKTLAAVDVWFPSAWSVERHAEAAAHDVAIVVLGAPAERVSTLELGHGGKGSSGEIVVIGYASPVGARLLESRGEIAAADETHLYHRADTEEGHSGAPVLQDSRVIGVHVAGLRGPGNRALAMNPDIRSWLLSAVSA